LKKAVPFAWLAAGAGGFFLRRSQLMTIFDPQTGFAEKGAPVSAALTALSVVMIALAVVFAAFQKINETECVRVFRFDSVSCAVYMLGGLAAAAAGVLWIIGRDSLIEFIMGILAALGGIAVILFGISMKRREVMGGLSTIYAVPALFFCLWLAVIYKDNAGNPQVVEFSYEALGAAAAAVSMYYAEGYVCGRVRPRAALCAGLIAVFFMCTAAANFDTLSEKLMAASAIVTSFVNAVYITGEGKRGAHAAY